MKFSDYKYERSNYQEIKEKSLKLINEFKDADCVKSQLDIINKINTIRNDVETQWHIAIIRYSIDTTNKFYEKEKDYWDSNLPLYEEINNKFYEVLLNSKFKNELEEKIGKQFFDLIELSMKVFSPNIIEDLQKENKLSTEYTKLLASAKISFEGEERNLASLTPFLESPNRELRKKALKAKWDFFKENENKIDKIYDSLVKVRDRIAKKLGCKNFVELGYKRMIRTDYNSDMVKNIRRKVLEYVVPETSKLYKKQRERLCLNKLYFYDEPIEFLNGNPTVKGNAQWILNNGKKMYSEISEETKEFFNFMEENELMDVLTKKGKEDGGYCNYIPNYKAPFVFANFNGTTKDVRVLTHEIGHAFNCYKSRWIKFPEIIAPTYDAAEIHSMSMELLTIPWMSLFFNEDSNKYKFYLLDFAVKFLPYGVAVDEFQHFIYENPKITPEERKREWRKLEKIYLPNRNYDEIDILERGCFWFQQMHIFIMPFYYIDYVLAQICAFQIWKKDRNCHEEAWKDYVAMCNMGGVKSFLDLIKAGNLKSPFEDACIKETIKDIMEYLESIEV